MRAPATALAPALALALALAGCVMPPGVAPADAPADITFDAIVVETELGSFTAIAFCGETPKTCAFMRGLVESGYYDGRSFGRVIPGFVIQEVDRTGGTTDQQERVEGEFGTSVTFAAGAFGIARDADPDSGGSEFFVMDHPATQLWGNYTAFAQVVAREDLDVVHAVARVPAVKTGPASSVAASPPGSPVYFGVHDRVPVEPVVMTRVTWTTLALPAATAARYPLQTSDTVRTDAHRATLEWGRDLAAGAPAAFTWYVAARDTSTQGQVRDPPPLALDGMRVEVVDGPTPGGIAPLELDEGHGEIAFRWTPPVAGLYHLRLSQGDAEIAIANVTVTR